MFKTTRVCHVCAGEGGLFDDAEVGRELRMIREGASISLRKLARNLNWSPAYLSKLETGQQQWNVDRIARYLENVGMLTRKKKAGQR